VSEGITRVFKDDKVRHRANCMSGIRERPKLKDLQYRRCLKRTVLGCLMLDHNRAEVVSLASASPVSQESRNAQTTHALKKVYGPYY